MAQEQERKLDFFSKYLTIWVALCMAAGVLIGLFLPAVPAFLGRFEYAHVSIPVAVLIWLMIYPMMLKIDFTSIINVGKNPRGLYVTWVTNWLIKPFTMYAISLLFFSVIFKAFIPADLAREYLAGAVLLGAAPCTAMVLVWSFLVNGSPAYTLVQVATNDLIILIAFTPIVGFLLGISDIPIPWMTLFLSVVLFVVIPLAGGWFTRLYVTRKEGKEYFENIFIPKFGSVTIIGLLLTLVIIFSFQGETIVNNPVHILLIALPFAIQTFLIFFIAYMWARAWKLPFNVASPAGMIGASNFFELAVAVAISLFGLQSGAVLATVVGVLEEVPIMLVLVAISKRTQHWFPKVQGVQKAIV
ncbi:MAG: ACR3 family arsenite efflux transporter [Dehalococcoidales bacterium]|nr:ACR3 family arsenite efflux transporter [Dehalococcoidales bacterium]